MAKLGLREAQRLQGKSNSQLSGTKLSYSMWAPTRLWWKQASRSQRSFPEKMLGTASDCDKRQDFQKVLRTGANAFPSSANDDLQINFDRKTDGNSAPCLGLH